MTTTTLPPQFNHDRTAEFAAHQATFALLAAWEIAAEQWANTPVTEQLSAVYHNTMTVIEAELLGRPGITLCPGCGGPGGKHLPNTEDVTYCPRRGRQ